MRRQSIYVALGNGVYSCSQWAVTIVIARLGSPVDLGQYILCISLAAPIFVGCSLNLRVAQAADQQARYSFGQYVRLRMAMVSVACAAIAVVWGFSGGVRALGGVVFAVGLMRSAELLSDVVYGELNRRRMLGRVALSRTFLGLLQVIAAISTYLLYADLLVCVMAMAASSFLVLLAFDLPNARLLARCGDSEVRQLPRIGRVDNLFMATLPLGIAAGLDSLATSLPRYVLGFSVGSEELGYFSAVVYFLVPYGLVVGAIADSARPHLARAMVDDLVEFRAVLRRLLVQASGLGLAFVVVALLVGGDILRVAYGQRFAGYWPHLVGVAATSWMWGVAGILGVAVASTWRFKRLVAANLAMVLVTMLAAILLIPRWPIEGAVASLACGVVVRASANYWIVKSSLSGV